MNELGYALGIIMWIAIGINITDEIKTKQKRKR